MVYNLSNLFHECATRSKRVGATKPLESDSYSLVWDAVTAWIESQLTSKRGASLHGFATVTYRKMAHSMPTSTSLQPVFLLHENFSRSSMMATRRSAPTIKELTINEEMNFSKLSLMYVKEPLKKDTIASCWKNMVARIGEVMKAGIEMRLDFGIGTMIAKDNKVDFNFSGQFCGVTMNNNNNSSSSSGSENTSSKANVSKSVKNLSMMEGKSKPKKEMDIFVNSSNATTTSGRGAPGDEAGSRPESSKSTSTRKSSRASSITQANGDEQNMITIQKKKLTARACALSDAETRQKVEEARMKREDERIERDMRNQLAEGNAKAEGIYKESVQREHDLGQFLKKQIAEKQMKKTKETTERRSTKLECDAVTCIPSEKIDDQADLRLSASRAQYAADLTQQILHKKMAMINDYEEDQVEHITRLERTTKELEATLSKRQSDRLMKQKQLSSAWKIQLGEKSKKMHKI